MDVVSTKRTQRKTTGLELDRVNLQLEKLWITERQLEEGDNTIMMAELQMDDLMGNLGLGMSFLTIKDMPTLMEVDIGLEEDNLDRMLDTMETESRGVAKSQDEFVPSTYLSTASQPASI